MESIALVFASFFLVFALVGLAIGVAAIIAGYKLFEKAGVAGWKILIPVYNAYVLTVEVAKLDVMWFIMLFASILPFFGWIVAMLASINISYSVCRRFTKEKDMQIIGTIFFGIFVFIFGFGKYKYDNGNYSKHGFFSDSSVDNVKSTVANGFSSSNNNGPVHFCKNCGNKVKEGEKFCANCGSEI
ncbi:MAG: zinc ribbon domain-containing protein [Bacilli bacterium]|nr:zinc ribbon domain-containing protein [Bacilli bacterium]